MSDQYFVDLQRRMHRLQAALEGRFADRLNSLLSELIDANEPGVALEMLVEALTEAASPVPGEQRDEAIALAERMKMIALAEEARRLVPG